MVSRTKIAATIAGEVPCYPLAMSSARHTRIGDYEIHERLGRGGMGTVYRAREVTLDRFVALKVLNPSAAADPTEMARFEKEARATSALNHPHLIQIIDLGSAEHEGDELHFIAMELVEGHPLRKLLEGPTPLPDILTILAQVADALDKCHEKGIVHRDVKPENILVTEDGYAKVVDFGIAKLTGSSERRAREIGLDLDDLAKTQVGELMGTLAYMAPEQISGDEIDARTDVFALGNIIFEAVMDKAPFRAESAKLTIRRIMDGTVPEMNHPHRMAPSSLETITRKCLAHDPRDRYASTREVAEQLRAVNLEMQDEDAAWIPVERIPFGKTATTIGAAVVLLVLLILVLISMAGK